MTARETSTNDSLVHEPSAPPKNSLASEKPHLLINQGGVDQPGGFINRVEDPRVGGAVDLPGGLINAKKCDVLPEGPRGELVEAPADDAGDYIPRAWRPAPWSHGGRPAVLTPPVREELYKLLSMGLSRRQAAAWLDIDHSTISHTIARDEEFARGVARAEELATGRPMMVLVAAARKDWRAAVALMKQKRLQSPPPPPPQTEEEKNQRMQERLADVRRELEFKLQVAAAEEEAKREGYARKRQREEAFDKAMLAKERAEREERKRRRAERQQKQGDQSPGRATR